MRLSENYNLNLVEGSDIVNPLTQDVPNYERIDELLHEIACTGVCVATELLSGTVHAITRENPNASIFRFVATADFNTGDTFTVDGVQVTALSTSGQPLSSGCYVINSNVLCCLVGTVLTVYCSQSLSNIHATDSDKFGGKDPSFYATAENVSNALNVAQSANTISLNNQSEIQNIKGTVLVYDSERDYFGFYFNGEWKDVILGGFNNYHEVLKFKTNSNTCESNITVNVANYCEVLENTVGVSGNNIEVYRAGKLLFNLTVNNNTGSGLSCNCSIYKNGKRVSTYTVTANQTKVFTSTIQVNNGDRLYIINDGANAYMKVLAGSYVQWVG